MHFHFIVLILLQLFLIRCLFLLYPPKQFLYMGGKYVCTVWLKRLLWPSVSLMIWCPSLLGLMALIPHPHVTATGITVPSSPCCSSHVPSTSLLSHSQRGRPNGKFGDLLWLRSCATYVFLGNVFLTTEEQRITDFSCRHFAKMLLGKYWLLRLISTQAQICRWRRLGMCRLCMHWAEVLIGYGKWWVGQSRYGK